MSLPSYNQELVDPNRRIDPHWLRALQGMSQILETLQSLSAENITELLENFQSEILKIQTEKLSRAEWEAENGAALTKLNNVRDDINRLGEEVKDATQTSTKEVTQLYGQNEQRVREINSLVAKTNSTNANVVTLSEAFATEKNATATQFTQVQTSIGDNTASVNELSTSVDGIEAQHTVSVTSNGEVDGLTQLSGQGGVSAFIIIADNFKVAHPNSGSPITAFTTELNGSTPVIKFNGTLSGDNIIGGTITGINIFGSTITGARFLSPGGGIDIDGRDENNLSITLGA